MCGRGVVWRLEKEGGCGRLPTVQVVAVGVAEHDGTVLRRSHALKRLRRGREGLILDHRQVDQEWHLGRGGAGLEDDLGVVAVSGRVGLIDGAPIGHAVEGQLSVVGGPDREGAHQCVGDLIAGHKGEEERAKVGDGLALELAHQRLAKEVVLRPRQPLPEPRRIQRPRRVRPPLRGLREHPSVTAWRQQQRDER